MNTLAVSLSGAGFVLVMGTMISYFSTIPKGKVPKRVFNLVIWQCIGICLAVSAIVWGYQSG